MKTIGILVGVAMCLNLFGISRSWICAEDGSWLWQNPVCWDGGATAPATGDSVTFALSGSFGIALTADATLSGFSVIPRNGPLRLVFNAGSSTLKSTADLRLSDSASPYATHSLDVWFTNGIFHVENNLYQALRTGINSNYFWITGPGTYLKSGGISGLMNVGYRSEANFVVISNGASVVNNVAIGNDAAGMRNTFVVTGEGTLLVCTNVPNKRFVAVGVAGGENVFSVENKAVVWVGDNGTVGSIVMGAGKTSNSNRFVIRSGGTVTNLGVFHVWGNTTTASDSGCWNELNVSDGGSLVSRHMQVGKGGSNNWVRIGPGGMIYTLAGLYLGGGTSGSANGFAVDGAGAFFITDGITTAGSASASNTMIVTNGGYVHGRNSFLVGDLATSSFNTIVVSGETSVLELDTKDGLELAVGRSGDGNRMVVSDGGRVVMTNVSCSVGVGNAGDGQDNRLEIVRNGALFLKGNLSIGGKDSAATNNRMLVADGGRIDVSGTFKIGERGAWNELLISNATVRAQDSFSVGGTSDSDSTGSRLVIAGTNAVLYADKPSSSAFRITGFGSVRFDVPTEGYAQTPVQVRGYVYVSTVSNLTVNATAWARKTGGTQELLTSSGPVSGYAASLTNLVAAAQKDSNEFDVLISADGTRILLKAPKWGTRIILR